LILKHRGKRPLGRSGHGWEDNVEVDVKEIVCEGMDWINLAQDRDSWWVLFEHCNESLSCLKCGESEGLSASLSCLKCGGV
jgi:hypothetical protein